VLFDGIRLNRGPSRLEHCCFLNTPGLADALCGNTSVKEIYLSPTNMTDAAKLAFVSALGEYLGLTLLSLRSVKINDESWKIMCESLATCTILSESHHLTALFLLIAPSASWIY
jgi:hypothetical protein